jgi:hypothetical protein
MTVFRKAFLVIVHLAAVAAQRDLLKLALVPPLRV